MRPSPQVRRKRAGNVATAVHRCAESVRARLPRPSTGKASLCWQRCHGRPQARRVCAGKVATTVHSRAESVRARLPASALCGSVSTPLTLSRTIHRPRGDSCGMNVLPGHLERRELEQGGLAEAPKGPAFSLAQPVSNGPFRRRASWDECDGGGDCDTPIWGLADVGTKV